MAGEDGQSVVEILQNREEWLLDRWMAEQVAVDRVRRDLMSDAELRRECASFLRLLRQAVVVGGIDDIDGAAFAELRDMLTQLSREWAMRGFSPSETATFVLSFKKPLFDALREALPEVDALAEEVWCATQLLDRIGLFTTEAYQRSRESIISRQQQELLELSTPVVKVWDKVLAVPLIGTLDSARTQIVMENLLQRIVEIEAEIAIIDITGVPTVDTLVAQHLIKTVAAARLMGADCIISGIRPQIAQTIVHLGVTLEDAQTKASLADAIAVALRRVGYVVARAKPAG